MKMWSVQQDFSTRVKVPQSRTRDTALHATGAALRAAVHAHAAAAHGRLDGELLRAVGAHHVEARHAPPAVGLLHHAKVLVLRVVHVHLLQAAALAAPDRARERALELEHLRALVAALREVDRHRAVRLAARAHEAARVLVGRKELDRRVLERREAELLVRECEKSERCIHA